MLARNQLQVVEGSAELEYNVAPHVDRGSGGEVGLHVLVPTAGQPMIVYVPVK